MNIQDIKRISYNPFFGSVIVPHFIAGATKKRLKIETVYLLFPFVFDRHCREILTRANSNSNMNSLFFSDPGTRSAIAGIEKKIKQFEKLTNQSLIVAANEQRIKINTYLYPIASPDFRQEESEIIREYLRAAYYLGSAISKENAIDLFVKLGIKEL